MGTLKAICISEKRGTAKFPLERAELVADWGIRGDAHAGHWHRQVSLLSYEKREDFKARGADIIDGSFGENLLIEGYDLKHLPVGTRFRIGDTLLEMSQIGKECHSHCEIFKRMGECIMPHEGVFAVVLEGGEIAVGDDVEMIPADFYRTLQDRLPDSDTRIATVVSGEDTGEKVLFMDGVPRGFRRKGRLLLAHKERLLNETSTGLLELDGNEIFLERVSFRPRLIICGGGHVSAALTGLAKTLDFEVTVLEDRELFAQNAEKAGADHALCGSYEELLRNLPETDNDYYCVLTRGHRFDKECLGRIYGKKHVYAGMMGSRRRSRMVKDDLREAGYTEEEVNSLHSPIGLSIGSETPEEIAVSIAAELISVRKKTRQNTFAGEGLIAALTQPEEKVLCTIVRKRGSAPREAGTKMLVTEKEIFGTIGGGSVEGEIILRAREMLRSGETFYRVEADMTSEEAADDGLICGGVADVILERL